jgi:hypothetical protein
MEGLGEAGSSGSVELGAAAASSWVAVSSSGAGVELGVAGTIWWVAAVSSLGLGCRFRGVDTGGC